MNSEPKTPDLAEQLAKLAKLHADGALSDEDFKTLKATLISQISDKPTDAGEWGRAPNKGAAASEARARHEERHTPPHSARLETELQKPKKPRRRLLFVVVLSIFFLGVILARVLFTPSTFMAPKVMAELTQVTINAGGVVPVVQLTNRDPNPITLERAVINNRPGECFLLGQVGFYAATRLLGDNPLGKGNPLGNLLGEMLNVPTLHPQATLKTGEVALIETSCVVVTLDVETDRGSLHWDF